MAGASKPTTVSTRQQRIAELAKQSPEMGFTSLAHHIDLVWLIAAYQRTRKDGAVGVDGQTAEAYAEHLVDNLQSLLDRAKSGTYRAPPVRRAYIPKGTGSETRPLGIPTFEDKVLQRAVVMVLEAVYEQDFRDCSYGYRPGRSAHQALDALWRQTMATGGGWVVEVDIRKFFDTLDHAHLRDLLRRRIRDGVLLRLIGKWLNAGVLEEGSLTFPEAGSPQGGVISPLLANIYLHYVLDVWFEEEVKPCLKGRAFLIRYADDCAPRRWRGRLQERPRSHAA
jgi:RNA-directed DNA polymerase